MIRMPLPVACIGNFCAYSVTGEAVYSMGPEEFALHMETLHKAGASLLGGCCGTDPEYIRMLCKKLSIS